jgi:lysophospholipase L1-like esterase
MITFVSRARSFDIASPTKLGLLVVLLVALETGAAAKVPAAIGAFYLQDGDRVVFYGDSITEQAHYTFPIELFVRLRFPSLNVSFVNSGWSGDRAWGGAGGTLDERLERDVIAHKPTVVTVMLGMNDGYYTDFDSKTVAAFEDSLEKLVGKLERSLFGVRITLIGTSPYDNVTAGDQPDWEIGITGGYNSVVKRFSAAARKVAAKHDLLFVDMNDPLVQLLTQLNIKNPALARQLIPDRIHPSAAAGMVMAGRLLQAWNAPGAEHGICIDLKRVGGPLRVRRELLLPYPFDRSDPLTKLIVESFPGMGLFRDNTLRIVALSSAQASVEIDGNNLGEFTAAQLAAGINLALDKQLTRQAEEVSKLMQLHDQADFVRWRDLGVSFVASSQPEATQAATQLAAMEQELSALADAAARPAEHTIEVSPAEQ